MLLMAIRALMGRKSFAAAVIAGSLPLVVTPAPTASTLLPSDSRAQLLSEPDAVPSRAIPYVITPERRQLDQPLLPAEAEPLSSGGALQAAEQLIRVCNQLCN